METAKEKGGGRQRTPRYHEHQYGRNKITVDTAGSNWQAWHWDLMDREDKGSMGWGWRRAEATWEVSGGRSVCCLLGLALGLLAPPGRSTGRHVSQQGAGVGGNGPGGPAWPLQLLG